MSLNIKYHRTIYEQHHGKIPTDENGYSYEIHHLDGNHENNDISNLICVSIQEHYDIHYQQGDWAACLLISNRMNIDPTIKSELSRKSALKRVKEGTHNFLGGDLQRQTVRKQIEDGTHPFLGENNPIHRLLASGNHPFIGGKIQGETSRKRVKEGTHNFLGGDLQRQRVEDGTHPFLGGEISRKTQKERIDNKTHNFIIESKKVYICPHCKKEGLGMGMKRWHFNNCREK